MKKLINGIVDFRKNVLPSDRERFAKLALGQSPDTFFIACSDSRVAPNVFASTDPGDLFVVRNPGNLFPPCGAKGVSVGDESEVAALEFAILNLTVKDIIICGHSECGAMLALYHGRENVQASHMCSWLGHGQGALEALQAREGDKKFHSAELLPHNQLSQLNVLQQLEHIKSYPIVEECLKTKKLRIHAWWFDIAKADVYSYDEEKIKFILIDERGAQLLLGKLSVK